MPPRWPPGPGRATLARQSRIACAADRSLSLVAPGLLALRHQGTQSVTRRAGFGAALCVAQSRADGFCAQSLVKSDTQVRIRSRHVGVTDPIRERRRRLETVRICSVIANDAPSESEPESFTWLAQPRFVLVTGTTMTSSVTASRYCCPATTTTGRRPDRSLPTVASGAAHHTSPGLSSTRRPTTPRLPRGSHHREDSAPLTP